MNYKHNREIVIGKGIALFWDNGFHHLGVYEICRKTGMTKGTFYHAFKSKENFLLVTMTSYGDLIVSHLKEHLNKTKSSSFYKLIALYGAMLKGQLNSNYKGCFINNMMSEMGTLNTAVGELSALQFDRFVKVIEPVVKNAQEDGDFDNVLSSSQLTEIIHTAFFGFLTRSKSTRSSMDQLMTLFFNALKMN